MRTASLYQWPAKSKLGRVIPKSKLFEQGSISPTVREEFVSQVQRITWSYKLAEETVHLRGDTTVPEIQIFSIDAKSEDVGTNVLVAIDKVVQFPIIFEINREVGGQIETRMVAAYKQLGRATPRLSSYFTTDWAPGDAPRSPLPFALNLPALYANLLSNVLPIEQRPGEEVSSTIERLERARELKREIAFLNKKLELEPQLNRKVELRRKLRDRTVALEVLTSVTPEDLVTPMTKDVSWTN